MMLCRRCAIPYDTKPRVTGVRQRCSCNRTEEEKWPRSDFPEHTRLCMCCLGEELRSGSRWSVWFCEDCKWRAIVLNETFGTAVIPIGRHSIMNGFALKGDDSSPTRAQTEQFVRQLNGMFGQINDLHEWMRCRLTYVLGQLGGAWAGDLALSEFLTGLHSASKEDLSSRRAFEEMCSFFQVPERFIPTLDQGRERRDRALNKS
jgi:hypothetical protein